MIKGSAVMKDGRVLLMIGLSRANVERLIDDEPILFDTAELEVEGAEMPSMKVMVFAGETEDEMLAQLREHTTVARVVG